MKAQFLLDVNVLLAVAWPTHRDHARAQHWLSGNARVGWATCPLTQAAFLRIVSNPSFSVDALTPRRAFDLLQANLAHPSHRFWPDDIDLAGALKAIGSELKGHQQVTDAYLLGLAIHHGAKFATMDQSVPALLPDKNRQREFIELI